MDVHQVGAQLRSAYKKAHNTETAFMKVKDDVIASLAQHQGVFLVLLDLSSSFDTVGHDILLNRLEMILAYRVMYSFGSDHYLSNRTTRVCIGGQFSKPQQMEFGLPQGSIVGPLGFSLMFYLFVTSSNLSGCSAIG